ncbi:MAG: ribonuclease P protein component [Coriobacteriia bacterium]|nr:ribonuclease P protein component [Coriobacteriia bacterium]
MDVVIRSSDDIGAVLKGGRRITTPLFSLYYLAHGQWGDNLSEVHTSDGACERVVPVYRVAYVAGKKNGNAVWRSRAKRKLRAAWRLKSVQMRCEGGVCEGVRESATGSVVTGGAADSACEDVVGVDMVLVAQREIIWENAQIIATMLDGALVRARLAQ